MPTLPRRRSRDPTRRGHSMTIIAVRRLRIWSSEIRAAVCGGSYTRTACDAHAASTPASATPLHDSHRVAVRIKPVVPIYCLTVRPHGEIVASERGHEHEQRRPGKMKIGDQFVHAMKCVGRTDENARVTARRGERGTIARRALERARRRGAHRP